MLTRSVWVFIRWAAFYLRHLRRWLRLNTKLCDIFGYREEELLDRRFADILHPDEGAENRNRLKRLFGGELDFLWLKLAYVNRYGIKGHVNFNANIIRNTAGEALYFVCIMGDISDLKQVENDLVLSERKFKSIVETIPDLVFRLDPDGRIIFANSAVYRYGYVPGDLYGTMVSDLVVEEDLEKAKHQIAERRTGERRTSSYELRLKLKSGGPASPGPGGGPNETVPVFLIESVGLYGGDEPGVESYLGTQIIARDISARKCAEDKIKDLLAEKEIIMREVHHRIKNNMSTMMALLSLQSVSTENAEAREVLKDARDRMMSMSLLYDKLYRSDNLRDMSVKDYLESLVEEIMKVLPRQCEIRLEMNIADCVLGAKVLAILGVIVNELVTNTMKYAFNGRESGLLSISLTRDEARHINLTMQDNGRGLPDEFKADDSKGFGLMLINVLAEQLEGSFRMEKHGGTRSVLEFNA